MDNIVDSFPELATNNLAKELAAKKDQIIREIFATYGFNPDDPAFMKKHITIVIREGDKFEHIYYNHGKPDAIRVISFERFPGMDLDYNSFTNPCKLSLSLKYF